MYRAHDTAKHRRMQGQVSIMMAFMLTAMLAASGLAIDLGRLYVVRADLVKAVDAGALAGARVLPLGNDRAEAAANSFAGMNYGVGFLGTTSRSFSVNIQQDQSQSRVQVWGATTMPTTFMRIVGLDQVPVSAFAEATRRTFQMALVLDTSGSLSTSFAGIDAIGFLRTAATQFVDYFDDSMDEMALVRFASGRIIPHEMGPNFKQPIKSAIAAFTANGGTTAHAALDAGTVEVTSGPSTGAFRALVFFTDGRPTSFRGLFNVGSGPAVDGVIGGYQNPNTNGGQPPPYLYDPLQISAQLPTRSPGTLPNGDAATNANILTQSWQLTLSAASQARSSNVTIFCIGLGNPNAGAIAQPDPTLLMAVANVPSAPDPLNPGATLTNPYYNPGQPEGAFHFAPDATQLEEVFQRVAQEIVVRLTQ